MMFDPTISSSLCRSSFGLSSAICFSVLSHVYSCAAFSCQRAPSVADLGWSQPGSMVFNPHILSFFIRQSEACSHRGWGWGGEKEREVETRSSEGLVKPGFIADAVLHGCILFVKTGYNEWGKLTLPLYRVYYKISKKHGWGGKLGYFYSLVCCPLQNALELRTW